MKAFLDRSGAFAATTFMRAVALPFGVTALVSACGGGHDDETAATASLEKGRPAYSVGGTVSGLSEGESLTLAINLLDSNDNPVSTTSEVVSSDGSYAFDRLFFARERFTAFVAGPAPAGKSCEMTNGVLRTMGRANVADVNVICTVIVVPTPVSVPFSVTGLQAETSVTVYNLLPINSTTATADGAYTFPFQTQAGGSYNVVVSTQPVGAQCVAPMPFGTVAVGMAPIPIVCSPIPQ